jgi:glutamyl-tRNA synthetase
MHIGNLRVAIFNYILSAQRGEKLLIRIEDTDKERNIDGKDLEILEILNRFKIQYSDVIYQSKNIKFHQMFAMTLLEKKMAFNCFCSKEILEAKKEVAKGKKIAFRYDGTCKKLSDSDVIDNENPFVVRLEEPNEAIEFHDIIKGDFKFEPKDIDDFIILRDDKNPTYNFACSIDDMLADISLVIRGEDHMTNTPKQIAIRNALGYDKAIEYAHLPIILSEDGKKMSKREAHSSVKYLLNEGFLPEAITNYLILLGGSFEKEIFTLLEAIEFFKLENISKAPARFDLDKLKFINREHIKLLDEMELSKELGYADRDIGSLAKIYVEEGSTIKEIKPKIDAIFSKKSPNEFIEEFDELKAILKGKFFETFDELKSDVAKHSTLKGKKLFKPLRYLLTGAFDGPEISKIYPLIKNYLGKIID